MRHMRTMILMLLAAVALCANGQKRLIVADVETLQPVVGASVTGSGRPVISDSLGAVLVADSCRSLVVTHINYESRIVNTDELRLDTIFLVSRLLSLQGVVVFGQASADDGLEELRKRLRMQKAEAQMLMANPNSGVSLLGLIGALIPKKWKKNRQKERKKSLQQILDEY